MGNYYREDFESGNESRLFYMDKKFSELVDEEDLRFIVDFNSFDDALKNAFSKDSSLKSFYDGMNNKDKELFFERGIVQDRISSNLEVIGEEKQKEIKIDLEQLREEVKRRNEQEKKEESEKPKTVIGYYYDEKTGKINYVQAKEEKVVEKGKETVRYKTKSGRYVSRYEGKKK